MDHLIIPDGAAHIAVPHVCTETYDGGILSDYPERQGWTWEEVLGADSYGGRSPTDVEAFFQTWLFFGLLTEAFKVCGIHIEHEDFVDYHRGIVTTHLLPGLFLEWKRLRPTPIPDPDCDCREFRDPETAVCRSRRCWKDLQSGVYSPEYQYVKDLIDVVRGIVNPYCHPPVGQSAKPCAIREPIVVDPPMAHEILMSIVALGYTLLEAVQEIYDVYPSRRVNEWNSVPLLRTLLEEKWCPRQATSMLSDMGVDGQYYLALSPGPDPEERPWHDRCTEEYCCAPTLDESEYVTVHTTPGCMCPHVPSPPEVDDVIGRGGIPILSWTDTFEGGFFTVQEYDPTTYQTPAFVAISHVWSDGMGNPRASSLPICLISDLQRKVNEVYFPGRPLGSVGFWMDTLCVPVHDPGLRKISIASMRHIYSSASAVLVLERTIQETHSDSSIYSRSLTLYSSKWLRRLWTYHEGGLARRVYFQFRNRSEDLKAILSQAHEQRRYDLSQGLLSRFLNDAQAPISLQFDVMKRMQETKILRGSSEKEKWMSFLPLAIAYTSRQTSRRTDEAICGGTVLEMDTMEMQAVDRSHGFTTEEVADLRMQLLYRRLRTFEPSVIFNSRPRLLTPGFRWAPMTVLGGVDGSWGENSGVHEQIAPASLIRWRTSLSNYGLQVTDLDGLVIEYEEIPQDFAHPDTAPSKFYLDPRSQFFYEVTLIPDHEGYLPAWNLDAQADYYLVLACPLDRQSPDCIAVLGRDVQTDGDGTTVYHEGLVWVEWKDKAAATSTDKDDTAVVILDRINGILRENSWVII